jgi:alpha-glucosidase
MALSVDGVYSYNLFGMPFIGSDICGFNGDAAPDLCTKWHQLGSLYPFARNHNQNLSASQEPYRFNTTITGYTQTYTDLIRIALRNRYSLIKYYYSAFH